MQIHFFRRNVVGVLMTAVVAATIGGVVPASGSTPSITTVISESKSAILHEQSLHYRVTVRDVKTKAGYVLNADIGVNSGVQELQAGSAYANVRVTPTYAYFNGNKAGLTEFFGMPANDEAKVGTKWVSMKAGTTAYKDFTATDTLQSFVTSLFPAPKTTKLSTTTSNGKSSYVLAWTATSNGTTSKQTLVVASSGKNLPTSGTGTADTVTQTLAFSNWGEKVSVPVPTSTIPFTSVS